MKKIKLYFIIFSLLTPFFINAQTLETGTLYRSGSVYEKSNEPSNKKIERFIYIDSDSSLIILEMNELFNMSTGEIIITYSTNGYNLTYENNHRYKVKEMSVDAFTMVSSDSLFYEEYDYNIGFRKVNNAVKLYDKDMVEQIMLGNKFSEKDSDYVYTFNKNWIIGIKTASSSWENTYRIINFEGYIFIKGAVSAPKIITEISKKQIKGLKLDYRFIQDTFIYDKVKN